MNGLVVWLKNHWALVLLALMVLLGALTVNSDIIQQAVRFLRDFTADLGLWAVLLYSLVYVVVALTGFSVTVMSVIALAVFEPPSALFIIIVPATVAAWIAFEAARHYAAAEPTGELYLGRFAAELTKARRIVGREAIQRPFSSIALLRLAGTPYIVLSYAAGLTTTLPRKPYVLATLASNVAYGLVFVLLGMTFLKYLIITVVILLILLVGYKFFLTASD